MSTDKRQPPALALSTLRHGEIELVGRLPWSSNFTFLVNIKHENHELQAVYKPLQGEQDLWDFPPEIYKREVAAYELSVALGWPNIPPTIVREDAPHEVGSLQQFMPSDFEQHFFTMMESPEYESHDSAFREIAVFDIIANNTDRKSGHCLKGNDGLIHAIDNGLCFHEEPKLRTVIWEYENEPIAKSLLEDVRRVATSLPDTVTNLLAKGEVQALQERMQAILDTPTFPPLTDQRQYPWPLV